LCSRVAENLGLPVPEPTIQLADVDPSPVLSELVGEWPIDGRLVSVITGRSGSADLAGALEALTDVNVAPKVTGPIGGFIDGVRVDRTYDTARSIEYDAVVVLADGFAPDPRVRRLVEEAYRHYKTIAVIGETGETVLT